MTGFDVDVLSADGPDMGDILVDSLFTPPPEFGESIPRKLYNYFFGSKDLRKFPVVEKLSNNLEEIKTMIAFSKDNTISKNIFS